MAEFVSFLADQNENEYRHDMQTTIQRDIITDFLYASAGKVSSKGLLFILG